MLKKSFFSFSKPRFNYKSLSATNSKQVKISYPKIVTLYLKEILSERGSEKINIGDKVKTGQKLQLSDRSSSYVISSVTGTIKSISLHISNYGSTYTAISIDTSENEIFDETFKKFSIEASLNTMNHFLLNSPGMPPIWRFLDIESKIKTILIYGGDTDLLIDKTLSIISDDSDSINEGVNYLKKATGIEDIIIVFPEGTIQNYSGKLNATVKTVSKLYPSSQPLMLLHTFGGKNPSTEGIDSCFDICFFKLEAIASIGRAFKNNQVPIRKSVTIIDKEDNEYTVNVRIGTHTEHILEELKIEINEGDRIVFGGPMTGSAIYSTSHPILADTDVILIQDKKLISQYSNYPCVNCGECVRVCPGNVPVNLLVRFLEANRYEEGADLYDLYSCIECGLCSYVCVSKIPVFQHIKLAKYELARIGYAKETTDE